MTIMEMVDLEAKWQKYDKSLSENTKINKEILKRILISKPEKRIDLEKLKAGFNLILPIALLLLVLIPNVQLRESLDLYIGTMLFGAVFAVFYYWSVRYYILLRKIDFSSSVASIKKNIKQVEKYKIMMKRLGFIFIPIAITGIFMMGKFPFFSKQSILPISLIIAVIVLSIYYTFKFSIFEQFRLLNKEIEELEKLEKD